MSGKWKLTICLMMAFVLFVFAGAVYAAPNDVEGHWAEGEISKWLEKGLIKGYGDGTVKPDNNVTRAEFITLVNRAREFTETEEYEFTDVSEEAWYTEEVGKAVAAGYISGYEDNTFRPNKEISRQEIAVIIYNIGEAGSTSEENNIKQFEDADEIADWSREEVDFAVNNDYINGYPDNTFRPNRKATRAETVVVLDAVIEIDGDIAELPDEIREWVDYSKNIWLAQDRQYEGSQYILVTYGEKPTGGYNVEITDITEKEDEVVVNVNFTEPAEGEPVIQVITYPYDIKKIEDTDKPVHYVAEGVEEYVPTLMGVDYLYPVVAQSKGIKVFFPAPDSTVSEEFTVKGVANVFEGTVLYKLLDSEKNELDSGITMGAMGDWGYFEPDLTVPEEIEEGEQLLLELYTESVKDGSIEDLVEIELIFQP